LLCQAYQVAKLSPPQYIQWVDGPLQLVAVLAPHSLLARVRSSVLASIQDSIQGIVGERVLARVEADGWVKGTKGPFYASVQDSIQGSVGKPVLASIEASVGRSVEASVWDRVGDRIRSSIVRDSVGALCSCSVARRPPLFRGLPGVQ